MITRLLVALLILPSLLWAGQGMGPGPGFKTYSSSGGPLIYDDFSSDTTANYTNISQTLSISGGAAHGTSSLLTAAYHETPTGSNDHWVSGTCTIDSGGFDSGCLLLGSNGTQYYKVYFSGGSIVIYSIPGTFTRSYNGSYATSSSHTVAAQIDTDGSSHARFSIWVDGVKRIDTQSDILDSVTRGQYVGLYFDRNNTNEDVTVDNLEGDAGAYTP